MSGERVNQNPWEHLDNISDQLTPERRGIVDLLEPI